MKKGRKKGVKSIRQGWEDRVELRRLLDSSGLPLLGLCREYCLDYARLHKFILGYRASLPPAGQVEGLKAAIAAEGKKKKIKKDV